MYKVNDIVLATSCAGKGMPPMHVKLTKKIIVEAKKGNTIDWPGYVGWECELLDPNEVEILRKQWSIPFSYPDKVDTFVFDSNIIKKITNYKVPRRRRRGTKSKRQTN